MTQRSKLAALALAFMPWMAAPAFTNSQEVAAQDGWVAWYGCWRADGAPNNELLCIVPDGGSGVRMITVVDGVAAAEARVLTDGRARRVDREGCYGTERAHWSADGRRVYLNSDLTCEGDVPRKVSGIFAITGPGDWLSAQAITIGDQTATRTVRYIEVETTRLPADILDVLRGYRTARFAARDAILAAAVDESDVDEALDNVDPNAVQEWLGLTGMSHLLPAPVEEEQLPATAVVNEHVATASNPYNYSTREIVHVVERPVYVQRTYVTTVYRSCWDPFFTGFAFSVGGGFRFGVAYSGGSCGHRYYYSRYSPWGYDLYGWRFRPAPVIVIRSPSRRPRVIIRKVSGPYRGPSVRYDGHDRRNWTNSREIQRDRDYDGPGSRGTAQPRDGGGRVNRAGYTNGVSTSSGSDRWAPQRVTTGGSNAAPARHPGNGSWTVTPDSRTGPSDNRSSSASRDVRSAQPRSSTTRSSSGPRTGSETRASTPSRTETRIGSPARTESRASTPARSRTETRISSPPRTESRASAPARSRTETRISSPPRTESRTSAPARSRTETRVSSPPSRSRTETRVSSPPSRTRTESRASAQPRARTETRAAPQPRSRSETKGVVTRSSSRASASGGSAKARGGKRN